MQYLEMVIISDAPEEVEKINTFLEDMVAEATKRGLSVETYGAHAELSLSQRLELIKVDLDWTLEQISDSAVPNESG